MGLNINVFFRADASVRIGSGHVMRCLNLADELSRTGCRIIFISRELPGNLFTEIEKRNYLLLPLSTANYNDCGPLDHNTYSANLGVKAEQDADETLKLIKESKYRPHWLVVDHYSLSCEWERSLRSIVEKILVIDDIAEIPHDCDLILNHNYLPAVEKKYSKLVQDSTTMLLGPKYVILNPEFRSKRKNVNKRDGIIRNILIYYGNVDPTNETGKTLEAIVQSGCSDIAVEVVIGSANPHRKSIEKMTTEIPNATLHVQLPHLAHLMDRADLAIGAGGTTTWERIYMGLPAIVITTADNQYPSISSIARGKGIIYLGKSRDVASSHIAEALNDLIKNKVNMQDLIADTKNLQVGTKFDKMVREVFV